jgi:hypothetical protein
MPKGSLSSHLGLHDPIHVGRCVLNSQRFKFLGNALPAVAFAGLGEPNDLRYAFPLAYQDAKMFGR